MAPREMDYGGSYPPRGSRPPVDSGWNRGGEAKKAPGAGSAAGLPASLPSRPLGTVGGSTSSHGRGRGDSYRGRDDRDEQSAPRERGEYFERGDREPRDHRRDLDHDWMRARDARPKERYSSHRDRSPSPRGPSHWSPRTREPTSPARSRGESSYRPPPRDDASHGSFPPRRSPPPFGPPIPPSSSSYRPQREREGSSYFPAMDRDREREYGRGDEDRSREDDKAGRSYSPGPSEVPDRTPLRRGGLSSRWDPPSDYRRERSPLSRDGYSPQPHTHGRNSYDSDALTRGPSADASWGPNAAASIDGPPQPPTGPAGGIPTGPRGGTGFPRGGPLRAGRGALRGSNAIPRGPSQPRGGSGPPGGPSGWMGRGGRGAGGPMMRGRGRGGMMGGMGYDEPPARSLARKVDAGGNAITPDLISVSSGQQDGSLEGALSAESGLEEGEREEGEMETSEQVGTNAVEDGPTPWSQSMDPPQRPDDLHLGSLPSRYSSGGQALPLHSQSFSKSGSNTPQTPVNNNPPVTTPAMQNPYSSTSKPVRPPAAPMGSATNAGKSTAQSTTTLRTKAIPSYTVHDFPRAVQPEWDAELWTLSAHRLSSLAHLPLSNNYNVPLSSASAPAATPTTPSVTPGAVSSIASVTAPTAAANLRLALRDLKEVTMEMEMSGFRRDECERSRAELM